MFVGVVLWVKFSGPVAYVSYYLCGRRKVVRSVCGAPMFLLMCLPVGIVTSDVDLRRTLSAADTTAVLYSC